jgi:hypothetical protein
MPTLDVDRSTDDHRNVEYDGSRIGRTMKMWPRSLLTKVVFALSALILIAGIWWGWVVVNMPPRDIGSLREITHRNIYNILFAALDYRGVTGHWPDTKNWVVALRNFFQDEFERQVFDEELADGWGTPLHCAVVNNGESSDFHCVSFGPNRADDQEQGDDVVGIVNDRSIHFMNAD